MSEQTNQAKKEQGTSNALEKIRPELNLEKWSFWKPTKSRMQDQEVKTIKREINLDDGSKQIAQVSIHKVGNLGMLTTEDQKTYYALIKIWQDKGRTSEHVFLSLKYLVKTLKKKWGSNVFKATTNSLLRLRTVPFVWKNSYHNAATGQTEKSLTAFNILSDLKIIQRESDGHITKQGGYFRFNDYILKNLLENHTKPLFLDIILNFRSEIAQLIYTYVDLIMADKTYFERRSQGLFNDLGLTGKTYRNPSDRKRKIEKAIKELQGVELSTGILTRVQIKPTKGQQDKDFKVVFLKRLYRRNRDGDATNKTIDLPLPDPGSTKLVHHFHQRLGRSDHQPTSKELDQATSLIANHDYEIVKYIIDYALEQAQKTNFKMRTFGAVFQYCQEALRTYESEKRQRKLFEVQENKRKQESLKEEKQAKREKEALDRLYNSLPKKEREKIDILAEQRFRKFGLGTDPASSFHKAFKQTARYHALRQYAQEQGTEL
jgi:hypothetical protein